MGKKVEKSTNRLGRDPLQDVERLIGEEKDESKSSKQSKSEKQSNVKKPSKSSGQKPTKQTSQEKQTLSSDSEVPQETSPKESPPSSQQHSPEDISEKSSSKMGLKEGWIRGTYILREKWAETIKDYAYWERLDIKEVLDLALEEFFKGKKVKPRVKKYSE